MAMCGVRSRLFRRLGAFQDFFFAISRDDDGGGGVSIHKGVLQRDKCRDCPLSNDSIGGGGGSGRPFFQICSTLAVTRDLPTVRVQGCRFSCLTRFTSSLAGPGVHNFQKILPSIIHPIIPCGGRPVASEIHWPRRGRRSRSSVSKD